jgi:hypothetical protein
MRWHKWKWKVQFLKKKTQNMDEDSQYPSQARDSFHFQRSSIFCVFKEPSYVVMMIHHDFWLGIWLLTWHNSEHFTICFFSSSYSFSYYYFMLQLKREKKKKAQPHILEFCSIFFSVQERQATNGHHGIFVLDAYFT